MKTDTSMILLEEEVALWFRALKQPRRVGSLNELGRIYAQQDGEVHLSEKLETHSVFKGMSVIRNVSSEIPENLGYGFLSCEVTYAGKPNIALSRNEAYLKFGCGVCGETMYTRELEPTRRT